ncbi:unnamed protein product [Vitrella brassicaformis CCMP3155]|uniref:Uncharacterized protein n=1 Tax=Vitrella brassicaformis (strain CCMP3155) TaxID=1169540 RepID=A0A0G4GWZ6_VITBC|nr:unnamed protein product [Vitrella brassicaformis CCMP3155]|mmetsp:Transcript_36506/g.91348  ORF Transcript_36506/g.91348 Transcript_36506/m.91348 type:complete len:168 (-) Transcript_36506:468-971(-)|eukprot:CEM35370.1 unnamed protein product [Vitrella brassicaformis CCMP3155]
MALHLHTIARAAGPFAMAAVRSSTPLVQRGASLLPPVTAVYRRFASLGGADPGPPADSAPGDSMPSPSVDPASHATPNEDMREKDEDKLKADAAGAGAEAAEGADGEEASRSVVFPAEAKTEERFKEGSEGEGEEEGSEMGEYGFRYKGQEPTTHGDWSHKGRCTDF